MMKHMPDTFKAVYPKDAKCKKNVQNDNTVFAHFVTLCVCVRACICSPSPVTVE